MLSCAARKFPADLSVSAGDENVQRHRVSSEIDRVPTALSNDRSALARSALTKKVIGEPAIQARENGCAKKIQKFPYEQPIGHGGSQPEKSQEITCY
jgi:hypothetical protein